MQKHSNRKRAVVAERGQVTIPKTIRDQLGLGQGTILVFEIKDSSIVVTKETTVDPVTAVFGCLKGISKYKSTEDYMNDIRGTVT